MVAPKAAKGGRVSMINWGLASTIAVGMVLGCILIALLVLLIKEPLLAAILAGLALFVGAVVWFLVMPAISTYLKATSNPEMGHDTAVAFWSIVGFYSAIAVAVYIWVNRKKKQKPG